MIPAEFGQSDRIQYLLKRFVTILVFCYMFGSLHTFGFESEAIEWEENKNTGKNSIFHPIDLLIIVIQSA